MQTRFTQEVGIRVPIVQGAMQWHSRAELCAAVSKAGGLGILTAKTFEDAEDLRAEIIAVRKQTDNPFAVNISMLPAHGAEATPDKYFKVCIEEQVPAIETAGRKPDQFIDMVKKSGIFLMHKVPAVRYALTAQKIGVDAVTLVGTECGGHPGMDGVSTMVTINKARKELSIPFLAGGGIVDGNSMLAALALGADGVVMGTRFLLSRELHLPEAFEARLLAAQETDTMLVMKSLKNPMRALANQTARQCQELEEAGAGLEELRPVISGLRGFKAMQEGDQEGGLLALGQGVGLIDEVLPVSEIIARTMAEAEDALVRLRNIWDTKEWLRSTQGKPNRGMREKICERW